MFRITERLQAFDSTAFREVFKRKMELTDPIDLSVGVPEELTTDHVKLAGIQAIGQDLTTYTPANGILPLRQTIAAKLLYENNITVTADQVTVVPGLTTGLLLVYMALLDPGDEIIVIDPAYPPYFSLPGVIGAKAVRVSSFPSFQLDPEAIEKAITSKTRGILVNSPNNPTGTVYSKAELLAVAKVAKKHNLPIISDEIYEHFAPKGHHFSIGSVYENTITMNGFSKSYAMTGWRLGYMAGPQEIINAINELQQYLIFSSSSIAQHAALAALSQPVGQRLQGYGTKRDLAMERLQDMGYTVHGGRGAYYLFFQTPIPDTEFVDIAATHNLLLIPGYAFTDRHDYVRLSYGASMSTLAKGLDILQDVTKEVRQKL